MFRCGPPPNRAGNRRPWRCAVGENVLYEERDRIAFVTLNRPEAKNAIDPQMHEALCDIWRKFRDNDEVDVAILTGAGDAFCAGADLRTFVPANYVNAS